MTAHTSRSVRIREDLAAVGVMLADLTRRGLAHVGAIIARAYRFCESWLLDSKKALYGLAVTRILLGVAAIGLLLANAGTRLYAFGSGSLWNGESLEAKSAFPQIWLFSSFHHAMSNDLLYTALYVLLLALAVAFTLGWRFKLVLPVFWVLWVSFIEANDMLGDQGDNMFRIVVFLLIFADPAARWSFDARRRAVRPRTRSADREQIGNLFHNLTLVVLTAQVSFVYVSGALYKAGGTPWSGGYAVYNPLQTDQFGTWPWLSDLATAWGPAVALATWGSILVQLAFPFLLLTRRTRIFGLAAILSFHIAIAVLMGLPWFSLAMIAVDAIFVPDGTWRGMTTGLRSAFADARRKVTDAEPAAPEEADSPETSAPTRRSRR